MEWFLMSFGKIEREKRNSLVHWAGAFCSLLFLMTIVFMPGASWGSIGGRDGTVSYFAQGQALAYEDDQARGRQAAVHNMQVQAVTQASGVFISPSQMGAGFEKMYQQILSRPEKYVQNYQVFSEMPLDAGLYKVTGMVNISLDLLRGDFVRLGFLEEGASRRTPQDKYSDPASPDSTTDQSAEPMILPIELKQEELSDPPRGDVRRQDEYLPQVLWGVTEKWNEGFRPVRDGNDLEAQFLQGLLKDSNASRWRITFPDGNELAVDESGEFNQDALSATAHDMGMSRVVWGKVAVIEVSSGETAIESRLQVLDVSSGQSLSEVHEILPLGDLTLQEGAVRMAAMVAPQLNPFLDETPLRGEDISSRSETVNLEGRVPVESEELELQVVSSNSYVSWLELEKLLRQENTDLEVRSLEIGQGETIVRVMGVTIESVQAMDGSSMADDFSWKVEMLTPCKWRIEATLIPVVSETGAGDSEETMPDDAPEEKAKTETVP